MRFATILFSLTVILQSFASAEIEQCSPTQLAECKRACNALQNTPGKPYNGDGYISWKGGLQACNYQFIGSKYECSDQMKVDVSNAISRFGQSAFKCTCNYRNTLVKTCEYEYVFNLLPHKSHAPCTPGGEWKLCCFSQYGGCS
jgi:hypothetical protein